MKLSFQNYNQLIFYQLKFKRAIAIIMVSHQEAVQSARPLRKDMYVSVNTRFCGHVVARQ